MISDKALSEVAESIRMALEGLENITTEDFSKGGDMNIRAMLYHALDMIGGRSI